MYSYTIRYLVSWLYPSKPSFGGLGIPPSIHSNVYIYCKPIVRIFYLILKEGLASIIDMYEGVYLLSDLEDSKGR